MLRASPRSPRRTTCLTATAEGHAGAGLRLTIDLEALARNWQALAARAAPAECAAAVKADGYGLGIEQVVPSLLQAGCRTFFVALPAEGCRVRAVAADAAIYVLNGVFPEAIGMYRDHRLLPVINTLADARMWAEQSHGLGSAIHVDTGMNRLGLALPQAVALADDHALIAALRPQLLVSHLASADTPHNPLNGRQLHRFGEVRALFPHLPASLANSAGISLGRAFQCDLVRPGIGLYGGSPESVAPVVTAEARILQIRDISPGDTVGYGGAGHVHRRSRVAILGAGYADGYLRAAGSSDGKHGGSAWLNGSRLPLLGRVSMDLIAVDVTDASRAETGDWVELFGPNMPLAEVAAAAGTIPYELLTGLSRRASRRYLPLQEA